MPRRECIVFDASSIICMIFNNFYMLMVYDRLLHKRGNERLRANKRSTWKQYSSIFIEPVMAAKQDQERCITCLGNGHGRRHNVKRSAQRVLFDKSTFPLSELSLDNRFVSRHSSYCYLGQFIFVYFRCFLLVGHV